jgi:hypothetical protein
MLIFALDIPDGEEVQASLLLVSDPEVLGATAYAQMNSI